MATPSRSGGNSDELANVLTEIKTTLATLSTRIGQNEEDYRRLSREQSKLSEAVERGFSELRASLTDRNKTPWGVIFSGFSITLTFAVVIGSLALRPLQDKDTALESALSQVRVDLQGVPTRREVELAIRAAVLEARAAGK
jgi:hypothetical protein